MKKAKISAALTALLMVLSGCAAVTPESSYTEITVETAPAVQTEASSTVESSSEAQSSSESDSEGAAPLKITMKTDEKAIAVSGVTVGNFSFTYPVIDNPENNAAIAEINNYFGTESGSVLSMSQAMLQDEDVAAMRSGETQPRRIECTANVLFNKNNLLTCEYHSICYDPLSGMDLESIIPVTFNVGEGGKILDESDIFNGTASERDAVISGAFEKLIDEHPGVFYAEAKDYLAMPGTVSSVGIGVTENGIRLVMPQNILGTQEAARSLWDGGMPVAVIPLDDPSVKSEIADCAKR